MPYSIGTRKFEHVMSDLGCGINIMHALVYAEFQSHMLDLTNIIVQLVDHSLVRPIGLVRDVLVLVNDLTFPSNFYVMNMDVNYSSIVF